MKRRIFSLIIALSLICGLFLSCESKITPATVAYAETNNKGITIDGQYVIPDSIGWCTYYVVLATNNTDSDISISADFVAKDSAGNVIRKVNDYAEAVKKGQQFILYGQFVNDKTRGAKKYDFDYKIQGTDRCAYNAVSVDTKKLGNEVEVSAINLTKYDVQSVGVRTLFLSNGKPVAFDTVNIADAGYIFRGGSTNSQVIGTYAGSYDDILLTYTTVANQAIPEDL